MISHYLDCRDLIKDTYYYWEFWKDPTSRENILNIVSSYTNCLPVYLVTILLLMKSMRILISLYPSLIEYYHCGGSS